MEMTFPDTRKNIVGDSDSTSAVQLKKKLCMTVHNGNNKSFHLHHVNKRIDRSVILTLTYDYTKF